MPKITGQAISIVGAVVLGQAAVEAGFVSASMVIVIGITAITNFVSPSFSFGITQRILQVIFMMLGISEGLFGLLSGTIVLIIHLVSLQSFGFTLFCPCGSHNIDQVQRYTYSSIMEKIKKPGGIQALGGMVAKRQQEWASGSRQRRSTWATYREDFGMRFACNSGGDRIWLTRRFGWRRRRGASWCSGSCRSR